MLRVLSHGAPAWGGALFLADRPTRSACEETPFRVLVVGSGLTGSLVAHFLRQRFKVAGREDTLSLTVWERSSYPGGRFGAIARHGGAVADLGAQVLSVVDPDDPRALGGHGITVETTRRAFDLAKSLEAGGVIVPAPDASLAATEERMVWEGLWKHHWAPRGMSAVLSTLLEWGGATPLFGVRVDELRFLPSGAVSARAVQRKHVDGGEKHAAAQVEEEFDCVIVCVPAPAALAIRGVAEALPEASASILRGVGYDTRGAEAHFFSPELKPQLRDLFAGTAECECDGAVGDASSSSSSSSIHLLVWQDAKRGLQHDKDGAPASIVAHAVAGHAALPPGAVYSRLAQLLGMTADEVKGFALPAAMKAIRWETAQMIRPMEALVADPPTPPWRCLENTSARSTHSGGGGEGVAKLVVAGDFMTHSSFLGCVSSAEAAAEAACTFSSFEPTEGSLLQEGSFGP
mmetsp:Transcript_58608/g.117719  ORF Transcript_58608/g.117719 Transcript_58608/m.117719 type:complete len:461 (+) Transcript_58608:173-1555(+)